MSTLTSKIQALLSYANEVTGKSDTTLGDAVRSLAKNTTDNWMIRASVKYDIPIKNINNAYLLDPLIINSFNGVGRWLVNQNNSYVLTKFTYDEEKDFIVDCSIIFTDSTNYLNLIGWNAGGLFGYNQNAITTGTAVRYIANINTIYNLHFVINKYSSSNTDIYLGDYLIEKIISRTHENLSSYALSNKYPIFAAYSIGEILYNCICKIGRFEINQGEKRSFFIPINHPVLGCTFVDLTEDPNTDAAYPEKIGTFTIE